MSSQRATTRDPRLAVIGEALEPYAWRRLSADMLSRHVLAALDGHFLHEQIGVSGEHPREPAPLGDERVRVVADALQGCGWRGLTLAAVGAQALRALDAWCDRRRWLDIELAWLLGDDG
jgi:hypothetical protein